MSCREGWGFSGLGVSEGSWGCGLKRLGHRLCLSFRKLGLRV